ncbi:chemotaxis protein CheW [Pseudomonas luteola]
MKDYLLFNLGGKECLAIDVLYVKEIIKPQQFHLIPGSTDAIEGCVTVRGITVPVINLPRLLFSRDVPLEQSMVILLDCPEGNYGIKVNSVACIVRVKDDDLMPKSGGGKRFTDGVFKQPDNSLVQTLCLSSVLAKAGNR